MSLHLLVIKHLGFMWGSPTFLQVVTSLAARLLASSVKPFCDCVPSWRMRLCLWWMSLLPQTSSLTLPSERLMERWVWCGYLFIFLHFGVWIVMSVVACLFAVAPYLLPADWPVHCLFPLPCVHSSLPPACPNLMCFFSRGNIEGTNSSKVCVWCCICVFFVCEVIGFVEWQIHQVSQTWCQLFIRSTRTCMEPWCRERRWWSGHPTGKISPVQQPRRAVPAPSSEWSPPHLCITKYWLSPHLCITKYWLSPHLCITKYNCHHTFASQSMTITTPLHHKVWLSPHFCITKYDCHLTFASQSMTVTTPLHHKVWCVTTPLHHKVWLYIRTCVTLPTGKRCSNMLNQKSHSLWCKSGLGKTLMCEERGHDMWKNVHDFRSLNVHDSSSLASGWTVSFLRHQCENVWNIPLRLKW